MIAAIIVLGCLYFIAGLGASGIYKDTTYHKLGASLFWETILWPLMLIMFGYEVIVEWLEEKLQ